MRLIADHPCAWRSPRRSAQWDSATGVRPDGDEEVLRLLAAFGRPAVRAAAAPSRRREVRWSALFLFRRLEGTSMDLIQFVRGCTFDDFLLLQSAASSRGAIRTYTDSDAFPRPDAEPRRRGQHGHRDPLGDAIVLAERAGPASSTAVSAGTSVRRWGGSRRKRKQHGVIADPHAPARPGVGERCVMERTGVDACRRGR